MAPVDKFLRSCFNVIFLFCFVNNAFIVYFIFINNKNIQSRCGQGRILSPVSVLQPGMMYLPSVLLLSFQSTVSRLVSFAVVFFFFVPWCLVPLSLLISSFLCSRDVA